MIDAWQYQPRTQPGVKRLLRERPQAPFLALLNCVKIFNRRAAELADYKLLASY